MPRKAKSAVQGEDAEDVTQMSNKELRDRLSALGIVTGPIVGKFFAY